MTHRDDLLHRVMAANPLPNEQTLLDGFADWRPPLAILIRDEEAVDPPTRPHPATAQPPLPPMTEDEDQLLVTERSRIMDTRQRPEVRDTKRPAGWRTAAIAFAVVIVVVGAVALIATLIGDDGEDLVAAAEAAPTLTFDGEAATYIGPTTLEAGTNTFSLDNTHDTAVDFVKILSTDESLTLEDVRAWGDPNTTGQAAWFGGREVIGVGMPGVVADYDIALKAGTYGLLVVDPFTGIAYPATVIQVMAD